MYTVVEEVEVKACLIVPARLRLVAHGIGNVVKLGNAHRNFVVAALSTVLLQHGGEDV